MSSSFDNSVDVAVSVYGKPYQTALALFSLTRHSGRWLDRIYFTEERRQPPGTDLRPLKRALRQLGKRVVYYRPWFWFGYTDERERRWLLRFRPLRHAIRYQYAWERTDKDRLLVMHNDVRFRGDLVGQYVAALGDHAGVGLIGQCWNCPAHADRKCDADRYLEYRPDRAEIEDLLARHKVPRPEVYEITRPPAPAWPLPECRLNEFAALVNLKIARPLVAPRGPIPPLGIFANLDTGVLWFRAMNQAGHTFKNVPLEPLATHAGGHASLFDGTAYRSEEDRARDILRDEFGIVF